MRLKIWRYVGGRRNGHGATRTRKFLPRATRLATHTPSNEDQEEATVILLIIEERRKGTQDTGEISQALKQRIVALMPMLEGHGWHSKGAGGIGKVPGDLARKRAL